MGKVVTLGEIMLRFSTDEGIRVAQASCLQAHYGGCEANTAVSLANFGHEVVFASKVPNNGLGQAVKKHLQSYGVSCQHLLMNGSRLGTYYVESGVGSRASQVIYDREHSSFAEITADEWSEELFAGADIFHLSGITAALSEQWQALVIALVKRAKKTGCKISFDVNYRSKLWSQAEASVFLKQILPFVDYCSAGQLDAVHLLNIPRRMFTSDQEEISYYYREIQKRYPNIEILYSTKRTVISADRNKLKGLLWVDQEYFESTEYSIDPIVDRIGGGDAFAGGLIHGILSKNYPQKIIDFATAAAVLKHTVYGDCNQFSSDEVEQFSDNPAGKILR